MKKMYSFVLALCFTLPNLQAQSTGNAVVYSEGGEKFTVLLNGEKQNEVPQSNVKMKGLTAEYYKIKIDFEDSNLLDFTENFAVQYGNEATYVVKLNKKGEYTCRFQSYVPISGTSSAPTGTVDAQTKSFAKADDQPAEEAPAAETKVQSTVHETHVEGSTPDTQTSQKVTMQTTTQTPANGDRVTMNVNVNGVQMGVDVNVEGMDTQQSTTTKTTTTTSGQATVAQKPVSTTPVEKEEIVTGACSRPMSSTDFQAARKSVSDKTFEDSKVTMAKQVIRANCFLAAQIKDMMTVFTYEESKLDFARFAYDYCFDPGNYYQVNDAFTFESSIEDLDKYIQSKK